MMFLHGLVHHLIPTDLRSNSWVEQLFLQIGMDFELHDAVGVISACSLPLSDPNASKSSFSVLLQHLNDHRCDVHRACLSDRLVYRAV